MQIGIDLGATKIEYVLLDNQNKELTRNRISTPEDYIETIKSIVSIIKDIENENKENLNVGICHPGATDKTTGLIKNAHNSQWLNNKNLIKDLKKNINNNIYLENDANCFCLSEAYDGSASHYETVFGIILGSGCGGGLVINKKIISGSNGLGGEWSLNQKKFVSNYFSFAFGQHSGVIDLNKDPYELPRFPINEKYGDLERFKFIVNLLPFQYKNIIPEEKVLSKSNIT